jgi:hypothetical protein
VATESRGGPLAQSKAFAIIGLIVLAAVAVWVGLTFVKVDKDTAAKAHKTIADTPPGKAMQAIVVSEEERAAYVQANVTASDVKIDSDLKPDADGGMVKIAGLLRVSGRVTNNGDRPVKPVHLMLNLLGETNEVLGTFLEDVTGGRPLEPAESREFKFTIPEKKEFNGRFQHKLK